MRVLSVVLFVLSGLWAVLVWVYIVVLEPYGCAFGSARGSCSGMFLTRMQPGEGWVFALWAIGPVVTLVFLGVLLRSRVSHARR